MTPRRRLTQTPPDSSVLSRVLDEMEQGPATRRPLIEAIERALDGRTLVTLFTSFVYPVILDDSDVSLLEAVLQQVDLARGLCLMLNSPGGDALAAERLIRVCRRYAHDDFDVLVPKAAKSAATVIALGANRLLMGATAELGPLDAQVPRTIGGQRRYMPAQAIVASYDDLLAQAARLPREARIEPYLQQLKRFDASDIAELRRLSALLGDVARRALQAGLMRQQEPAAIERCVQFLTTVDQTMTHGRALFPETLQQQGLAVEVLPLDGRLWELVFQLYLRTDHYVSTTASKTIEAARHGLSVAPPADTE